VHDEGVCAQCLQKHVDPVTGKESIIFSCFNQDQELDRVDFPNLRAPAPEHVQEKIDGVVVILALWHASRRSRPKL
jgi:hypothetical protein